MELWEFVKEIDLFGKEPEFYLKGKPKQQSLAEYLHIYL